ncbi:methyltransferase [Brachybacterium nesterenkovii]|uniref:23S rRNA (Guanine-N-2-)-methyltransferase rlmG n=1 Tax=Brachybacterium nesterenkovii TaxID=47847 RepID=A0A1X6WWD2_9MICO|nr:methyltransferase [Brachybacterium nesterenkovii]SLM89875.1 23S rRNA (guanine-N-2-)-methyltransferase rlmG [Brachybacterium nesterenkovii]
MQPTALAPDSPDQTDRVILREAEEIGALAGTGDVVVLGDATGALVRAALEAVGDGGDRVIALDMSRGALEALAATFGPERDGGRLVLPGLDLQGLDLPGPDLQGSDLQGSGADPDALADARCALMRLPKSLAALQARMLELRAVPVVIAGGRVKHMTRSQNDVLATTHREVRATRGLGKSRALVASGPRGEQAAPTRPAVAAHELEIRVAGASRPVSLRGIGGVFGGASADAGSLLLLDALDAALLDGSLEPAAIESAVDLGCGNGLLTAWLAHALPQARLRASDDDADAVAATRATLEASGLAREGVDVVWEVSLADAADAGADLVVLNPPFHDGTAVDATLVQELLDAAGRVLRPGGQLWLVHNSLLRYRDEVADRIGPVRQRARDRRFTVLSAEVPTV